jgi:hypothetical protein
VERFTGAPSRDGWRTTFLRLLFGKRIGTLLKEYETVKEVKSVKKVTKPGCPATFFNVLTL